MISAKRVVRALPLIVEYLVSAQVAQYFAGTLVAVIAKDYPLVAEGLVFARGALYFAAALVVLVAVVVLGLSLVRFQIDPIGCQCPSHRRRMLVVDWE